MNQYPKRSWQTSIKESNMRNVIGIGVTSYAWLTKTKTKPKKHQYCPMEAQGRRSLAVTYVTEDAGISYDFVKHHYVMHVSKQLMWLFSRIKKTRLENLMQEGESPVHLCTGQDVCYSSPCPHIPVAPTKSHVMPNRCWIFSRGVSQFSVDVPYMLLPFFPSLMTLWWISLYLHILAYLPCYF